MPTRPDGSVRPGFRTARLGTVWRRAVRRASGAAAPPLPDGLPASIEKADRLRDERRFAEAARAYAAVLERTPERPDIRVQLGNMLKDAGQPGEAVAAYRLALASRPDDPDAHLQLGHALKLLGDRTGAVSAYRAASRLGVPDAADRELAAMGEPREQVRAFAARPWEDALRSMADLRRAVDGLRADLDRVSASLPALGSLAAVPVEAYDRYRAALAIPPPPAAVVRRVTVLCLADALRPDMLARQIASVRGQVHGAWRLLVLGTAAGEAARRAVEEQAREDPRIAWITIEGPPAAEELRVAAEQAGPVLLLARGALLDSQALGWFALAFDLAEADAFVCDEEISADVGGCAVRLAPTLRQVVDPDTLAERNTFGDTLVVSAEALRVRQAAVLTGSVSDARWSLLLDLAEDAAVGHIPFPLAHRPEGLGPEPADPAAVRRARKGARPRLAPALPTGATIAVVVPSRDNGRDVEILAASLRDTAERADLLEIVVLDNGGTDADSRCVLDRLAACGVLRRIACDEPFNWSRLSNLGAAASDAPLLVFANDDMRMLTRGWDARLRTLLTRAEVGAVGAKLLYPDGTLQHAGILFGWTPTPTHHDGVHRRDGDPGPAGRWGVTRAVSAVTGAFLATRRDVFLTVGGFDAASLPVGYGDVDYALKLRAAGHRILWTPHIALHHYESKTRGLDRLDPVKAARAEAEDRAMLLRWPGAFALDPGVHPAWRPESLPFRLLDPWSTARAAAHVALTGSRRPWLLPAPARLGDRMG